MWTVGTRKQSTGTRNQVIAVEYGVMLMERIRKELKRYPCLLHATIDGKLESSCKWNPKQTSSLYFNRTVF